MEKIGIYVDLSNIAQSGGYGIQFDVLKEFVSKNGDKIIHFNVYIAYDEKRAKEEPEYKEKANNFHSLLRNIGIKVIIKKTKYYNEKNKIISKSNVDLEMAIDILIQSENLDKIFIMTGDGDFKSLVRALQNKGCRVEIIGFQNISRNLKNEADMFISGYLIPDLLPTMKKNIVRGICYHYNPEKGIGFFNFIGNIEKELKLWITDSRKNNSPYENALFYKDKLPQGFHIKNLPSRDIIFEFEIEKNTKKDGTEWFVKRIINFYYS